MLEVQLVIVAELDGTKNDADGRSGCNILTHRQMAWELEHAFTSTTSLIIVESQEQ